MKSIASKIVRSLNEAMDPTKVVENEPVAEVNAPKQVHQCTDCATFYLVDETTNESVCPECGGKGTPFGDVKECTGEEVPKNKDPLTEDEEAEIKSEAEVIVGEALRTLDRNDYKKFNESYRPRTRITSKGELEVLIESKGHVVTASRRMTSRQKTAYNLSEKYVPAVVTPADTKKFESIRLHRQELMIKNESRAIKIQACKILERQGAKYNFKKFNESMDKFLNERIGVISKKFEDIASDDEIGKSELDKMTPDEIGDQVTAVIEDTGLEVVTNDVDIDGDTATVNVRVQDSDGVEVHTKEVEDVLTDVFDTPVEIVGPYQSEGDKSVADLAVVINPDDKIEEGDKDLCPECGKNPCECDDLGECDDPMLSSEKKYESLRRRKNEQFVTGVGDTPLFALVSNETASDKSNAPEFLAQDDSLISGNEDGAENLARIFVSEEAAKMYLASAGIEDKFTPVSISIIQNESMNGVPSNSDTDEVVAEGDDSFETEDGTYFKEDGYCYCRDKDGKVREIDESEYDAACTSSEMDRIKESYKRRSARKK